MKPAHSRCHGGPGTVTFKLTRDSLAVSDSDVTHRDWQTASEAAGPAGGPGGAAVTSCTLVAPALTWLPVGSVTAGEAAAPAGPLSRLLHLDAMTRICHRATVTVT